MAYSARPTSTDELTKLVNQIAHGFVVGDIVIYDGSAYIYSRANSLANCQGTMIVTIVTTTDNFYVTQVGYVTGLPAIYVAGTQYYVSASASNTLTSTAPSSVGSVILPCFVADSDDSGYFYTGSGQLVEPGALFAWTVVGSDTPLSVNNGYITASGGTLNLTLPASATIGDVIRIANSQGNFTIVQGASQRIVMGNQTTTIGAGGSLASTGTGDTLELLCIITDIGYQVLSSMGNITVV